MFSKLVYKVFPYDPKFGSRDPWQHLKIQLGLYGFLLIIMPVALTSRKFWSNLAKSYRFWRARRKYLRFRLLHGGLINRWITQRQEAVRCIKSI